MGQIVVPYDNFTGGDYGRMGPYNAPKNTFDALNMYVTRQGELTVRPGLRNVTPPGVAAGAVTFLAPYVPAGGSSDNLVYFQGGVAKRFVVHQAELGTLTNVNNFGVTAVDYDQSAGTTYAVTSGATINIGFSGPNPGTGGGVSVAVYGNRIVTAAGNAVLNFSDVGGENGSAAAAGAPDFAHFTATNALTIGDPTEGIVAIRAQRTHLVIIKASSIWVLTGDMRNATIRQVARTFGPFDATAAVRSRSDEMLWYVPSPGMSPWKFDGTHAASHMDRIIVPAPGNVGGGQVAMSPLPTEDGGAFVLSIDPSGSATKSYGWLYYNGIWTKHDFPVSFQKYVAAVPWFALQDAGASTAGAPFAEATLRSFRETSSLVFADTGATPKFYAWSIIDRPGSETRPLVGGIPQLSPERAGDNGTAQVVGSVTFPEWHSPSGEDVQVRSVIVDFTAFNTGGSLTNHFDVNVISLRQYNADGTQVSATLSYDEAGSAVATGGTTARRVFSFGDQGTGNGFQVSLTNVRGVSIRRVTVVVNTLTTRGSA